MTSDLLIRNVRPMGGPATDILVRSGRIAAMGADGAEASIPVLDGGHVVFLLYEGITGKPPDERVHVALTYAGLFLILGLMVLVLGLDFGLISRH